MDVRMLPVCSGILNLFPLNPVCSSFHAAWPWHAKERCPYDFIVIVFIVGMMSIRLSAEELSGNVFQAESQVIWSDAEVVCQQANATQFKPDKGSFDMQLFANRTFDGNSWVAASYTYVSDPVTSFRIIEPDARDRCIAFEVGYDCTGQYWHKACNETYSTICESYTEPVRQWILGRDITWIAASDLCHSRSLKLATHITNTRQFFNQAPCQPGFHWTGSVIEVAFQSNMLPSYSQGACGFLQNHILSFGNCSRMIRPLCVTAEKTISGTNSLQHNTMTITSLNGEFSSSITSSYWMTHIASTNSDLTRTPSKGRHTTHSLSDGFSVENVSSSLPTDTQIERDIGSISFKDETLYLSDAGVLIGCVLGGTVFIFIIVLLVIILRKRLTQGNARIGSVIDMNPKTLRLNTTQNPTHSVDDPGMAVLQHGSANAGNVPVTSSTEGLNGDLLEEISMSDNSINFRTDVTVDDTNYRQMKTKFKIPNVYDSIHLEDDSYDHVEYEKKPESGKVTVHIYDKANFHLRHERVIQGSIACDTTDECNTRLDKYDGE